MERWKDGFCGWTDGWTGLTGWNGPVGENEQMYLRAMGMYVCAYEYIYECVILGIIQAKIKLTIFCVKFQSLMRLIHSQCCL